MPQKKSSQLYSVTPKSYLRKPSKKRKDNRKWIIPGIAVFFCSLILAGILVFLYSIGSPLVSPLPVAPGEKLALTPSQKTADEVKRLLGKHSIMYTDVYLSGNDIIIAMSDNRRVFLTKKKDIGEQISSLQVILPRLTMKGSEFRTLDLRFDKPVVTN